MIQNRRFALAFRLTAFLFAAAGLMKQIGIFDGMISFHSFMYYTIQSNLLVIVLFAMLSIKTVKSLREDTRGTAGFFVRFEMVCVVNVLVTFIVFWTLLVGTLGIDYLLSFENLAVHGVTPLLCLADYILFSEAKCLKYRDAYFTCIFPLFYVIFTSIAGLAGYVYHFADTFENVLEEATAVPVRFPYFFLDFDRLGVMTLAYIAGILAFILLFGHGMYAIDRKVRKDKDYETQRIN